MRSEAWLALALMAAGCGTEDRIFEANVVDPSVIAKVSKLRSCCGHDYSGGGESNRSMKHYLIPSSAYGADDHSLAVFAPADGEIVALVEEQHQLPCFGGATQGVQVHFVPRARPDLKVRIFHVRATHGAGRVNAGEQVGWADLRTCDGPGQSPQPGAFDVSVESLREFTSYFEHLEDGAFDAWRARGIATRGATVISRDARDADPCTSFGSAQCEAETLVLQ